MTELVIYLTLSLAIVFLAARLVREDNRDDLVEADPEHDFARGMLRGASLSLAERVFDATDYLWLRDKLCFPGLASTLARSRKRMALLCLKALKRSFDDLVRAPEIASSNGPEASTLQSWQFLWLILRFHLLLEYATLAVRIFGPYHRLVPSLDWLRTVREPALEKLATKRVI